MIVHGNPLWVKVRTTLGVAFIPVSTLPAGEPFQRIGKVVTRLRDLLADHSIVGTTWHISGQ